MFAIKGEKPHGLLLCAATAGMLCHAAASCPSQVHLGRTEHHDITDTSCSKIVGNLDILLIHPLHLVRSGSGRSSCGCITQVDFAAARAPFADRKRKADVQVNPGTGKAIRTDADDDDAADEAAGTTAASEATAKDKATRPAQRKAPPQKQQPRQAGQSRAGAQKGRQRSDQPTEKQQLVMTVAVGGIPPGCQEAVLKLAGAAGKVGCAVVVGCSACKSPHAYLVGHARQEFNVFENMISLRTVVKIPVPSFNSRIFMRAETIIVKGGCAEALSRSTHLIQRVCPMQPIQTCHL